MITDKDIRFRVLRNGVTGRIEVKEIRPETQRANLAKYKTQIDKMAAEFKQTGELQYWLNRKEVLEELKDYARSKGVRVYDKVVTGEKASQQAGNLSMKDVIEDIHDHATAYGRVRAITGGAQAALGLWLVYPSSPAHGVRG